MALGTASIILADLADDIFLNSDGMVLALIAAIGIHLLNFILGIFSPTIQSIRLHYVEFFNQFYQAGGIKFNPFKEHLVS
jgi:V/A-type H+-transporting ATPase subunit I